MENQTTEPVAQSEQPVDVAQQPEATPQETVLTETETPTEVNFKDLISDEYKDEKSLQNFNSVDDLVKSYLSAQRMIGANKIAIPNKMATEEDWKEVFSKLGAPNKPEDYKYSFKEDEINPEQLKAFNETAHRLGLLPQQAERLIKFYNEMNQTNQETAMKTAEQKQMQVENELKKEFGAEYEKRLDQAKKLAVETFGVDMLNNTLLQDGTRLGDNIEVIKAMSMLADKLSEDEIIKGDGVGYMTASELQKEIDELTEDGSPYWNKSHPNHQKTVDQVYKLREQLNG